MLIIVTKYGAGHPHSVRMQKTKYGMKFAFENQKYATMFNKANIVR